MKKQQRIRQSRLFKIGPCGFLEFSSSVQDILADITQAFPSIKQLIWTSYRADNEIHELLIVHPRGRFVLTMESGFGPTVFPSISQEDWELQHKQVEFVDSVDIFHFVCCLVELHQLYKIQIEDEKMIYSS